MPSAMGPLECGIVILPPAELAGEMRRWQAGFLPAYLPVYPPHLTVKSLFRCRSSRTRIETAVARVCAKTAAFSLTVDGVECFCEAGVSVFFVAVLPSEPLLALHSALLRALATLTTLSDSVTPGYEGKAYRPHLTLLSDVPEGAVEAARVRLAGFRPACTFPVDSISLICHFPDQAWQPGMAFALRGAA